MAQNLISILQGIRGGAALTDASKELAEVVRAVKECGKKGSITLKIDIEPDKADETVVTFQPDVTIKKPKRPYAKGLFFVDQHGGVHREDPRQIELELTRKADIEKAGAIAFEQSQRDIDKVGRG